MNVLPRTDKDWKTLGKVIISALFAFVLAWYGSWYLPAKIAEVQGRNHFVERFSEINYSRVFAAERFYRNATEKSGSAAVNDSWGSYMHAVEEWNKYNVSNPVFIQYYFDQELRDEFTHVLLPAFVLMHDSLFELRTYGTTTSNLPQQIEWAKNRTFYFSEKMLGIEYKYQ